MTPKQLDQIAYDLIASKIERGEIVEMQWAVTELISHRGDIGGEGVPFFILCAREHVYRIVKKVVDKYDKHEDSDQQMTLSGFEYLQCAYTVERENQRKLIPVNLLTDEELLARAKEFRRQSAGMLKHAKEIEDYVESRRSSRSA
jgi:hypothetical protein